ncbi:MAG: hypothetical protein CFE26_22130, partial [Verrucomicrobiales bacterium VVV1]
MVAGSEESRANVGLLVRLREKGAVLERLRQFGKISSSLGPRMYKADVAFEVIQRKVVEPLLGNDATEELSRFVAQLFEAELMQMKGTCNVHYPLIDWHWPVFGLEDSWTTSM